MVSATERSIRARIGAHSLHASYDSRDLTKNARVAFDKGFEDQVDPDRTLPETERLRRAASARKAYFAKLALKSAQARRRKADAK